MTFNFLGPGLTVNVEAKVKEQIILDSSGFSPSLARTKPTELIWFGKMKRIVLLQIEKHGSNFGC